MARCCNNVHLGFTVMNGNAGQRVGQGPCPLCFATKDCAASGRPPRRYKAYFSPSPLLGLHFICSVPLAPGAAVVGCETMAMVIALIAGRRVFTSIPPGGRPCRLPQREIRPL